VSAKQVEQSEAHKQELEAAALTQELDNPDARLADNPLEQLVDGKSVEHAVLTDSNEPEQEMDDIIVDVEEIERQGGKVLRKLKKFWGEEGLPHVFLNLAVYIAGVFVSLGLYATCFRHRDVKQEQEFRYGACECLGDGRVCICGLCCPAIRWADTISEEKGGFLDFSSALLVMMGLGFMCLCPYSGLIAWIGIVFVGVYYRQRIRLRYGLEADTVQSYIEDVFVWCCCAWCAICQEARQVDEETTEEEVRVAADPKQSRSMSTSW
jgi:Cys-rich protein (TIGR01571 family)